MDTHRQQTFKRRARTNNRMGKDEGLTGGEVASEGRLSALRRAGRASMSRRASEVSGAVKNFDAKSAVDAMLRLPRAFVVNGNAPVRLGPSPASRC